MEDMLRVGVITSTHGVRGEVKVFLTTDDPRRLNELKKIILNIEKEQAPLEIEQMKYFKDMVILKFKGYDNINDAEKYRSKNLPITRDHAVELGSDEYFITDLIRPQVPTKDGETLDVLKGALETDANDVYVVEMKNDKELLIPAIKNCTLNVDIEQGTMTVHLPESLVGL